jgi:phospholipase/carboxylesterase
VCLALGLVAAACEPKSSPEPTEPRTKSEPVTIERKAPAPEPAEQTPPEPELPTAAGVHYLELVTAGAKPEDELPMIVAIHGLGDEPRHFSALLAGFDRPVRLIFPQALAPYEGGGFTWYPRRIAETTPEEIAVDIEAAADKLAPAIVELTKTRPTKGKPILTGFSQGGMLSFALAVEHGELFSAVFPVGGWLPDPLQPGADGSEAPEPEALPPIKAFHGTADRAVAYEPTKQGVDALADKGYAAELVTYEEVGHAIPPNMREDLWTALRAAVDALD